MIRIGITQGDINGVGPEVIVKALGNSAILELFTPVVFANAEILSNIASQLHIDDFRIEVISNASEAKDGVINVVDIPVGQGAYTPGTASAGAGKAAVEALEAAVKSIEDGNIDLLVTAPIDKNSVQSEEFKFTGHTEYLEDKFSLGNDALMILADGDLRVSLVTIHTPLSNVAPHITKDRVVEAIKTFNSALRMDFGRERPKIAVLSLNPHCGDGGVIGNEETEKILPAVEECRDKGIMAFGPIAADGLFGSGAYKLYDGILAMYHDQGLAPFKTLAGSRGVNFTAGIDIIRTSPDHGTAYDIAGKGVADETSMREAIYAAIDIARRRNDYLESSENPLEIRPIVQKGRKQGKEKQNAADDAAEDTETE